MLPKDKGSKNRNYSQERIKKIGVGKVEESKEEGASNREPKKFRDENKPKIRKAHSKDTKVEISLMEMNVFIDNLVWRSQN